ncbi:MAG: hypothetical protein FJW35_08345 [Acidobacteria bacterium]|nr:hypothetical protein [Acidobacteriota bacterium]
MDARRHSAGPFKEPAPGQVEIREGGGCLSIFGIPFLAAGIFLILTGARVLTVSNSEEVPAWGWPMILLMGFAFAGVGGNLVFGRRWIILDSGMGMVFRRWGLLLPLRNEQLPLADYESVRLLFEEGDSDSSDRYPVVLQGRGGIPDLVLSSPVEYPPAREQAVWLAGFLRLPLVDASTDHEVVLSRDDATRGFAVHEPAPATSDRRPARPSAMRSRVECSGRILKIIVPETGFSPAMLLGLILPAGILGYVIPRLLEFFGETHTPRYVAAYFVVFLVLFFGVLPALGAINRILRSIRGRTTLEASAEGIVIEEQASWRRRRVAISAGEIFGIDYSAAEPASVAHRQASRERPPRSRAETSGAPEPPGTRRWRRRPVKSKGVLLKCSRGIIAVGAGLPDEEVRYLYFLVKRALCESRELRP